MSRKGENIYKRKDNRWEARYIKGYHPDGSAKFGYCYGKSYREAKRKLTEAKASLISGKPVSTATKKRRIAFYCDEWLRLNRDRVKQSTYVKYSGITSSLIRLRKKENLTEFFIIIAYFFKKGMDMRNMFYVRKKSRNKKFRDFYKQLNQNHFDTNQ